MEGVVGVAGAAEVIGVSERRVRALIDSGQLPATRVLGRWAVSVGDAAEFRSRAPGRPLSEASAWAVLTRIAGTSPKSKLPSRLERRLHGLPDRPNPVQTLTAWTARRADTTLLWVAGMELEALEADERVLLGGGAALRGVAGTALRIYLDRAALEEVVGAYRLDPRGTADSAPVTVSAVGDLAAVPRSPADSRRVAAPVAAIDVLDAGYSKTATQLLESALGALTSGRDIKEPAPVRTPRRPHAVAATLEELRGPVTGPVRLPVTLDWGPKREYDLDDLDDERRLYRQVIGEATTPDDLGRYLRGDRLVQLWPELHLPKDVAARWEDRFPELASAAARATRRG